MVKLKKPELTRMEITNLLLDKHPELYDSCQSDTEYCDKLIPYCEHYNYQYKFKPGDPFDIAFN